MIAFVKKKNSSGVVESFVGCQLQGLEMGITAEWVSHGNGITTPSYHHPHHPHHLLHYPAHPWQCLHLPFQLQQMTFLACCLPLLHPSLPHLHTVILLLFILFPIFL